MTRKKSTPRKKGKIRDLSLDKAAASAVRGGDKIKGPDGSPDRGIHFKYDLRTYRTDE